MRINLQAPLNIVDVLWGESVLKQAQRNNAPVWTMPFASKGDLSAIITHKAYPHVNTEIKHTFSDRTATAILYRTRAGFLHS